MKNSLLLIVFLLSLSACCDRMPWLPWCPATIDKTPELNCSPDELDFGKASTTENITLTNGGDAVLDWNIGTNRNWIISEVTSGTTSTETEIIAIKIIRAALEYGNNVGTVSITSNGGDKNILIKAIREPEGDPFIQAREGNNCTQNNCGGTNYVAGQNINFQNSSAFENDEARSFNFTWLPINARIIFYDSPSGSKNDDWTEVLIKKIVASYCLGTLEQNLTDEVVTVTYHRNNGLDGKVSRMEMK